MKTQKKSKLGNESRFGNERGQGLIEYLIIVALMGIATIAIVRVMGQTVASRFASVTYALQGKKKQVSPERIDEGTYKKKDLGDFFEGVGDRGSGQ
jgi:Flp pilus assembly pilin Flp